LAGLGWLAWHEGLFARAGLAPTVKAYSSGKEAIKGLLAGEVAVAAAAEVPVALAAIEHVDLRVLASIGSDDNDIVVTARRERGVTQVADLLGRRIATQPGSALHYGLQLLLLKHGLRAPDVELVFVPADSLVGLVAAGLVDAASTREPYTSELRERLGDAVVVFREPGLYRKSFLLVTRASVVAYQPEALRRLLGALVAAEDQVVRRPGVMETVIRHALGLRTHAAVGASSSLALRVSLDQALLRTLEDIAAWAPEAGVGVIGFTPDFSTLAAPGPLGAARPSAVQLVH
jgi:NitT/TauT family transport system substrate-binding protein